LTGGVGFVGVVGVVKARGVLTGRALLIAAAPAGSIAVAQAMPTRPRPIRVTREIVSVSGDKPS
jgi:hypothetical protein